MKTSERSISPTPDTIKSAPLTTSGSSFFSIVLGIILIGRYVSEAANTFIWDKANYLWAGSALAAIFLLLWPLLSMLTRRENNILVNYLPIFVYLTYLMLRINFSDFYSVKAFLSEFIVWFCFVLTIELCSRNHNAAESTRKLVLGVAKILVLIGLFQITFSILQLRTLNPLVIIDQRPGQGIFVHQSIYLVMIMPFFCCFLKQRDYLWILLILIVCMSTGTRSPFLALICSLVLLTKIAVGRRIGFFDMLITLMIILLTYGILIYINSHGWHWENVDSRWSFGTLQWRVAFWQTFLENTKGISILIGHGLGTADFLSPASTSVKGFPPHNDYLRIYYDTGLIGLFFFFFLIAHILRLVIRSLNDENDFILPIFLMILCFHITDNFIYVTNALLVYTFLGTYIQCPAFFKMENFSPERPQRSPFGKAKLM
jgi:hypothetical protein